jgi:hypothetical protein
MVISEETKADKYIFIGFIVLLVLILFVFAPYELITGQQRRERAWHTQGCQMYDDETTNDVPAKCLNYFTDHYKPQQQRTQPPETK